MKQNIFNQLLTSTVDNLFSKSQSICQSKLKLRHLQAFELNSKRNSSNQSQLLCISQSSLKNDQQTKKRHQLLNIQQWIKIEAPKRLKLSISVLKIKQTYLKIRNTKIDNYFGLMSIERLSKEKKKVKNELKLYDNDFRQIFGRLPNDQQKQPIRLLYIYYKELKKAISNKFSESQRREVNRQNISFKKSNNNILEISYQ